MKQVLESFPFTDEETALVGFVPWPVVIEKLEFRAHSLQPSYHNKNS